jgi:glycosyltransferase involved in cell wall biosynthesis
VSRARVLHLLWEPARSGISRHVLEVVRALPDLEHAVLVPDVLPDLARELTAAGAEARLVSVRGKGLPAATWRELPGHVRALSPDVVHLHALEAGLFGTIAAKLGRAPRVVFQPQTTEGRRPRLTAAYLALVRRLGAHHRWVAVSEGQARALREHLPAGRVHVVPNCVTPGGPLPDRAAARARLGWPADAFVVVCVARLAAQKDPLGLVRAALGLPRARVVLVGDGPLQAEVARAARAAPNVHLQGPVRGLDDVLAAADVLTLPSLWEGMSLTLLEAMARGVPVVATAIDGNTDAVEDGTSGLLVPPRDPDALRRALAHLQGDPDLRRRLGDGGRARVAARFSPEAMAAGLRAVYAG